MEHKLITGGEQFLPFARSRIKALRATGLAYASQQFEVDGCSIKVRIEPGQEYITLSGGGGLEMESGVAYMLSVTPVEGSEAFSPGVLHATKAVKDYNAPFSKPVNRKAAEWWLNPSAGSSWQFSGELDIASRVKGRVPRDRGNSRAFAAGNEEDSSTTPPTWKQKEHDEMLFYKKLISEYCPASIFTGRCRLYVQAIYGQYLYPSGFDQPAVLPISLSELPYTIDAPSSLKIFPARRIVGGITHPDVQITSSSGVYFNDLTGEHWLINVEGGDQVSIYPLVASRKAENIRHLLKTGAGLDTVDHEHLEAYILGCSLPDVSRVQYVAVPGKPSTWSLGYGWHWNHAGTCADMVENTTYPQDNEPLPNSGLSSGVGKYFGMRSTHFRLTVSPPDAGEGAEERVWLASVATISGPDDWSTPAGVVILTEVDWGSRKLIKIIPRYTIPKSSSATFYAFYLRDELQLCTVSNTVIPPKPNEITYSDSTYYAFGSGNSVTIGMGNGWLKNTQPVGETYEGTVTCGGVSAPYSGFGKSYYEDEVDNKQETGFDHSDVPIGQGGGISDDWSTNVGYPPYSTAFFPYNHTPGSGYWAESVEWYGTVTFDKTTSLVHETQGAYCIFVPPINDSQAGYLLARTHNNKYKTGRVRTNYKCFPGGGKYVLEYRSSGGSSGPLIKYNYCSTGSAYPGVNTPISDLTTDDIVSESYRLVCGAGVIDVKTSPLHPVSYALLTIEDDSPDAFETRTSVGGAVIGDPNKIDPQGLVGTTDLKLPTFVGWA